MVQFECEKCKVEIVNYKDRVQVLDPIGFTHTFCKGCGDDHNKKIEKSNASIAETGKLGHLDGQSSRSGSVRF